MELLYDGEKHPYRARLVEDASEYDRLWQAVSGMYIGFDCYQSRAGGRRIPLFLLEPR